MHRIEISHYQEGKQNLETGVSTINFMDWTEVLPYYSLIWKKKQQNKYKQQTIVTYWNLNW